MGSEPWSSLFLATTLLYLTSRQRCPRGSHSPGGDVPPTTLHMMGSLTALAVLRLVRKDFNFITRPLPSSHSEDISPLSLFQKYPHTSHCLSKGIPRGCKGVTCQLLFSKWDVPYPLGSETRCLRLLVAKMGCQMSHTVQERCTAPTRADFPIPSGL